MQGSFTALSCTGMLLPWWCFGLCGLALGLMGSVYLCGLAGLNEAGLERVTGTGVRTTTSTIRRRCRGHSPELRRNGVPGLRSRSRGHGKREESEGIPFRGLRAWERVWKGVRPEQPWLRPWEPMGSSAPARKKKVAAWGGSRRVWGCSP